MAKVADLQAEDLKRVRHVLDNWADSFSNRYKEKFLTISASGELENSINMEINLNGNEWEVVMSLKEYWKYIEYGRQPGTFPPVNAMIDYIGAKSIVPRPHTLATGKQVVPTENQLAFLMGRNIQEQGIEAKPFLQETLSELKDGLIEELAKAFAEDLSEHIDILFNL